MPHLGKILVSISKGVTLAHEAAHIAEARISGRWTHGELFERLYERGKEIVGVRSG
jgi:hypothetical protein